MNSRSQLTLFVPPPWGPRLDELRVTLDPRQAALIASHVTLCREDEIAGRNLLDLFSRVESSPAGPLNLIFGHAERFCGHGILLPCKYGAGDFNRLREWLLQDQGAREHGAHITLAHPRNPRSSGNTDSAPTACPEALAIQFAAVALIEQHGSSPWRVVQEASLGSSARSVA